MVYLFSRLGKIRELLCSKFILLLMDYDGTLSPIAQTPKKAIMPKGTKKLLQELSLSPYCKLGIVSGRSLQDLMNTVGLKRVIYAGNHGLEIKSPKIRFESLVAPSLKSAIRDISADIKKRISGIKGALIEDKGLTLTIHYRLTAKKDLPMLKKAVFEAIHPYIASGKVIASLSKKAYEIKPLVKWDKGRVALWLLARQRFISGVKNVLPVYIGDDATDEDAFRLLKGKGLTVFVGKPRKSKADYYLKDTRDVVKFLRLVADLKLNRTCWN